MAARPQGGDHILPAHLELTDREEEVLGRIHAYYADKRGRYPEKGGDIRLIA